MSDLDDVRKDVVALGDSLKSLEETAFETGVQFKGFTKSLVSAASNASDAGKTWTTFSRLVSGSPLWAVQNKFRAYLEILAGFEKRSQANAQAQLNQAKAVMENFEASKKLNKIIKKRTGLTNAELKDTTAFKEEMEKLTENYKEQLKLMNRYSDRQIEHLTNLNKRHRETKALAHAQKESKKEFQEQIKETNTYNYILEASGDSQRAYSVALQSVLNKQKVMNKETQKQRVALKQQYAFDQSRIKTIEEITKRKAEELGLDKKATKERIRAAKRFEKKKMKGEQDSAVAGEARRGIKMRFESTFGKKQLLDQTKGLKLALAPIYPLIGLVKLAKGQRKISLKAQKFANSMTPVLNLAFKFFVFAIMGIFAFLIFIKGAYEVFKILREMGLIEELKEFFFTAWEIVSGIIGVIGKFISGDYKQALKELGPLLDKLFILALDGLGLLAKLAWETIVATFYIVMQFLHDLIFDENLRERAVNIGLKIGKVLLAAYLVKTLALMALQLVATYAAPVLLGIFILAGLYSLAKFAYNRYAMQFVKPFHKFFDFITDLGTFVRDKLIDIKDFIKDLNPFSEGGRVNSDFQLVGEKGPEIVKMPRGSTVYSNAVSKQMISKGSNTVVNNMSITINARDTSDAELRRIADKIGNMVNNKINRRTSSRTLG